MKLGKYNFKYSYVLTFSFGLIIFEPWREVNLRRVRDSCLTVFLELDLIKFRQLTIKLNNTNN